MDPKDVFLTFGISLGLGLLVGLQREYAATSLAGIRTFALITLLGTVCGFLGHTFGPWVVAAGGVALAGVLVTGSFTRRAANDTHTGITTEIAALLMYAVGGAAGVAAACLLAGRRGALTFWRVGEGRGGAGAGAGGGLGMMSFGQGKGVGGDVEAWPLCQQNGCSGYPPNRL